MNDQAPESRNWQVEDASFYDRAYPRIFRAMYVIGIVVTSVLVVAVGWRVGAGFFLGCAVSVLNFYWLKQVISSLVDRTVRAGKAPSSRGALLRFLLRYLLMALVAYVIFRVSLTSLYGLLAGLFLPVAGIMAEAGYELYATLKRRA